MATLRWLGGTAVQTKVSALTISGAFTSVETLTTALTAEDGTTVQTVTNTTSTTVLATIVTDHLALLQASVQALFTQTSFSLLGTSQILVRSVTAGVPHYLSSSDTAAAGAWAATTSTSNAGPNDWNVTTNWSTTSLPASSDIVQLSEGGYDVLYGLYQNAINLRQMKVTAGYRGAIGQPHNNYYLTINITNGSSSVVNRVLAFSGSGRACMVKGSITKVYVNGGNTGGTNMLKLNGDIDDLYVTGSAVSGYVQCADSMTLDTVTMTDAAGAVVILGQDISSLDTIVMRSGRLSTETTNAGLDLTVAGGICTIEGEADEGTSAVLVTGGELRYNGSGTIHDTKVYGGVFTLALSEATAITLTTANVYGGTFTDEGSAAVITYTNPVTKHGGNVGVQSGQTVTVAT